MFLYGIYSASSKRIKREKVSLYSVPSISDIIVPSSPTEVAISGMSSGQITVNWVTPTTLFDGTAFGSTPVTSFKVRIRRVDTLALVGGTPVDVTAPTTTVTISALPATALYVTVSALNGAESEESLELYWTQT